MRTADIGPTLPPTDDHDEVELGIQLFIAVGGPSGWAAQEIETSLRRVLDEQVHLALAGTDYDSWGSLTYSRITEDGRFLRFSYYVYAIPHLADALLAAWPFRDIPLLRPPRFIEFDCPVRLTDALVWDVDEHGQRTLRNNGTLSAQLYPIVQQLWRPHDE